MDSPEPTDTSIEMLREFFGRPMAMTFDLAKDIRLGPADRELCALASRDPALRAELVEHREHGTIGPLATRELLVLVLGGQGHAVPDGLPLVADPDLDRSVSVLSDRVLVHPAAARAAAENYLQAFGQRIDAAELLDALTDIEPLIEGAQ